jgi:hypothetical protein
LIKCVELSRLCQDLLRVPLNIALDERFSETMGDQTFL